jgi:hypothetical protein
MTFKNNNNQIFNHQPICENQNPIIIGKTYVGTLCHIKIWDTSMAKQQKP